MLVELAIRDIVLIDRLNLGFAAGMSVLTGETGAGKSILLDAFALALGARGDGSLVRLSRIIPLLRCCNAMTSAMTGRSFYAASRWRTGARGRWSMIRP
mgnify:CR=1 FL=1